MANSLYKFVLLPNFFFNHHRIIKWFFDNIIIIELYDIYISVHICFDANWINLLFTASPYKLIFHKDGTYLHKRVKWVYFIQKYWNVTVTNEPLYNVKKWQMKLICTHILIGKRLRATSKANIKKFYITNKLGKSYLFCTI